MEAGIGTKHLCDVQIVGKSTEHADQMDVTVKGNRFDRLLQGSGTAHFNDVVDSTSAGDASGFFGPVWRRTIVDGVIGAQGFTSFEFFIR